MFGICLVDDWDMRVFIYVLYIVVLLLVYVWYIYGIVFVLYVCDIVGIALDYLGDLFGIAF